MTTAFILEDNEQNLPGVYHPWRRYFARMLDVSVYTMLWRIFLVIAINVNVSHRGSWGNILDIIVGAAMMLFIEPLLLKNFKTTLGKAIFGLQIETANGHSLTYQEGLERTWELLGRGMGYHIPFYNLYRLWKSYELCQDNKEQPWDYKLTYFIKDTKWYRTVLWALAHAILFGSFLLVLENQQMAPNKGNLTIETFVENHQYYSKLYQMGSGEYYLDSTGQWVKKPSDGSFSISFYTDVRPEYDFVVENGLLQEVSLSLEIINSDDWIDTYSNQMILAALAFGGAQEEVSLFSGFNKKVAEQISYNVGEPFEFVEAGIQYEYDVDYRGYSAFGNMQLIADDKAKEKYYYFKFKMRKLD